MWSVQCTVKCWVLYIPILSGIGKQENGRPLNHQCSSFLNPLKNSTQSSESTWRTNLVKAYSVRAVVQYVQHILTFTFMFYSGTVVLSLQVTHSTNGNSARILMGLDQARICFLSCTMHRADVKLAGLLVDGQTMGKGCGGLSHWTSFRRLWVASREALIGSTCTIHWPRWEWQFLHP